MGDVIAKAVHITMNMHGTGVCSLMTIGDILEYYYAMKYAGQVSTLWSSHPCVTTLFKINNEINNGRLESHFVFTYPHVFLPSILANESLWRYPIILVL